MLLQKTGKMLKITKTKWTCGFSSRPFYNKTYGIVIFNADKWDFEESAKHSIASAQLCACLFSPPIFPSVKKVGQMDKAVDAWRYERKKFVPLHFCHEP